MITNCKHITINKSILHIIQLGNRHHFNSVLLPQTDEAFNEFLIKHIKASLGAKARKSATFRNTDNNITLDNINSMFSNDREFIDNSKHLAGRLLNLCRIKNAGPFDLIICEFENEKNEKYIAILLLEFTHSFFHEVSEADALIKQLTVLASSNSEIKKCAIVQEYRNENQYDMIVNDKQLAAFFISDFLKAELYMDDRKAAETFIEETIGWVNNKCKQPNITLNEKIKLEEVKSECINCINRRTNINIDNFQESLFVDELEPLLEEYNNALEEKGLINKEINLTEEVVKDYKYHKIKLDNNIEIKIPIALIDDDEYSENYHRETTESDEVAITIKGIIERESIKTR